MAAAFSQPDWDPESGQPYPGGAEVAERIAEAEKEQRREQRREEEKERALARRRGQEAAEEEILAGRRGVTHAISTHAPSNVEWLWENRIPIGEITLLAGKAGIGKSQVLGTWASWLSVGEMRGAYYGSPQNVIYVPNEDSIEKALLPRLMAADADLDRIHILRIANGDDDENTAPLVLPEDCERMAQAARHLNAVAVFLDPMSSNMSDKDRNKPEVRQSYERLRRCAEQNNLAIIGNGHLKKGQSQDLLEAVLGSSEIGNIVRAAMGVIVDPDADERQMILSQCKNNYAPMGLRSYVYRIVGKEMWTAHGLIRSSRIEWLDSTDRQVNDLMAEGMAVDGGHTDIAECAQWLADTLRQDPNSPRAEVMKAGAKQGYKEHTIKRAARRLRVVSQLSGYPCTARWSMPMSQVTPDGNG